MIDQSEKKKFSDVCERVISSGRADMGIGSLGEKYMHLILKSFICANTDFHEVGQGRYFADVLIEDTVYEIQTGGYYPLKKKLQYYLSETDKRVVIVTPVVRRKRLIWVDPETGATDDKGRYTTIALVWVKLLREMYWLAELLDFKRMSFWFPVVSVDEYRKLDGRGKDKKIKATKIEKIPRELLDIEEVACAEDVARLFLPNDLPERFTASDYSGQTGARRLTLSSCIHALETIGVIEKDGKIGSAIAYRRIKL